MTKVTTLARLDELAEGHARSRFIRLAAEVLGVQQMAAPFHRL